MSLLLVLAALALAQDPAAPGAAPATGVETTAPAPTSVDLAWTLPQGRTIRVEQTLTTRVDTPLAQPSHPITTQTVTTSEQQVTKGGRVGADAVSWTEKVVAQQVSVDSGGEKVSWSSDSKDDPPGGLEGAKALLGATWTVDVGADQAVTVTGAGLEAAQEKLHDVDLGTHHALDEKALAAGVRAQLASLKPGAYSVGTPMISEAALELPAIGKVTVQRTVTLEKIEQDTAFFSEKLSLLSPVKGEAMELKSLVGSGALVFDMVAGLPIRRTMDLDLDLVSTGEEPIALKTRVETDTKLTLQ